MTNSTENQTEVIEIKIYGYKNQQGMTLWTSNLEFANVMANKYGTLDVYIEKM
jgi:hypothetical protein